MRRVDFQFTRSGTFLERGGLSIDIPEDATEEEAQLLVRDTINKGKCAEYLVSERYYPESHYEIERLR